MTRSKDLSCQLADVERGYYRFKGFKIPSREDRDDLWPGDLALLVFESIGYGLWVRVTGVLADGSYVGILASTPLYGDPPLGVTVTFTPENIAYILSKMHRRLRSSDRGTEIGNEQSTVIGE